MKLTDMTTPMRYCWPEIAMKLTTILCGLFIGSLHAGDPRFDSIDYADHPNYLNWPETLGDRESILNLAAPLKGDSDHSSIRNVLSWMKTNLSWQAEKAYAWRDFDDIVGEGCFGGCADQAIVCGVLLKAVGIPCVWVKTMDVAWIWDFKRGRPFQSWSGHVFLEVYLDQQWQLLDAGAGVLYGDYHPEARILPGNRFAYDKGNDPRTMILSLQWEEWKAQTESYFRTLDEALLPVDVTGGTGMTPEAWIAGNSPYYQAMTQMAIDAGFKVRKSFNTDFATFLPQARGHLLLVETHNGVPIVPIALLEEHYPGSSDALAQGGESLDVAGTKIRFLDFSKPLRGLGKGTAVSGGKPN